MVDEIYDNNIKSYDSNPKCINKESEIILEGINYCQNTYII